MIDWLFFNVLVNFLIKIILDVGEGILLSNFYYDSDNCDIRDIDFFFFGSYYNNFI